MTKFSKHKWWIVTALITVPLAALAAVPNVFTSGTVISSAQVNANFAALDARLAALEAATARSSAQINNGVLGNIPTGKTITFTSSGVNPMVAVVSASAFTSVDGATMILTVQLDGTTIGQLQSYANEGNSHKTLPTRTFSLGMPTQGTHNLGLLYGNPPTTTSDANDYYGVTFFELH